LHMWVFGYGSLMWDGWEIQHGCTRRTRADLSGYRRIFNKASVRNWGTEVNPCPTLNVTMDLASVCRGFAFEFPPDVEREVLTYLHAREGPGFAFIPLSIRLDDHNRVASLVPIYEGKDIVVINDAAELIGMMGRARGMKGTGAEYVLGVAQELAKAGVDDPVVSELSRHFRG
jgi:cation transport protein ChaC